LVKLVQATAELEPAEADNSVASGKKRPDLSAAHWPTR